MKLLFSGNNAFLEIDVQSYQHPNSTNTSDSNWLSCKVLCQIDSLGVRESLSLETYDFVELQKSILAFNAHISDTIEFSTIEEQLCFTIKRNPKCLVIEGKISAMPPTYGVFTFKFEAETLAFSTIEALENITLNFPIVGQQ